MTSDTQSASDPLDRAADWFARRDAGLTDDEADAFDRWLGASVENREAYATIEETWGAFDAVPADLVPPLNRDTGTSPVPVLPTAKPKRPFWIGPALAACLALAAFFGLDGLTYLQADQVTKAGETRTIPLADGSSVTLNTDSAIAIDFQSERRTIQLLKGEAAFVVAADAARPFQVIAAGGSSTVLGTVFIVRILQDGAETKVLEGRVAVSAGGSETAELGAHRAVRYNTDGMLGQPRSIDPRSAFAWRRGKMVFEDRPLGEVIDELSRYHAGAILLLDDGLRSKRVNGVFPIDDPLAVLDVLEKSLGIQSTRMLDRIILLH